MFMHNHFVTFFNPHFLGNNRNILYIHIPIGREEHLTVLGESQSNTNAAEHKFSHFSKLYYRLLLTDKFVESMS